MIKSIDQQSKGIWIVTLDDDYFDKVNEEMKGKSRQQILSELIAKFTSNSEPNVQVSDTTEVENRTEP